MGVNLNAVSLKEVIAMETSCCFKMVLTCLNFYHQSTLLRTAFGESLHRFSQNLSQRNTMIDISCSGKDVTCSSSRQSELWSGTEMLEELQRTQKFHCQLILFGKPQSLLVYYEKKKKKSDSYHMPSDFLMWQPICVLIPSFCGSESKTWQFRV